MKQNRKKANLFFLFIIGFSIVLLISFILLSISMILIRGLPNLQKTLFIEEIQFAIQLILYTSLILVIIFFIT